MLVVEGARGRGQRRCVEVRRRSTAPSFRTPAPCSADRRRVSWCGRALGDTVRRRAVWRLPRAVLPTFRASSGRAASSNGRTPERANAWAMSASRMPRADSVLASTGKTMRADAEFFGDGAGVDRAGAAEAQQREIARIEPLLEQRDADGRGEIGVGDAQHACGGAVVIEAQGALRCAPRSPARAPARSSGIAPPRK